MISTSENAVLVRDDEEDSGSLMCIIKVLHFRA